MNTKKKFAIYLLRWQLSGVILWPCIALSLHFGFSALWATIASNLIGGCCFWFFDNWLIKK